MAFDSSTLSSVNGAASRVSQGGGVMGSQSAAEMGDQFLKLLVTQLKNQDPLSPMENAEFTSQIAQINTVSGIDSLNNTLSSITGQIDASQKLQAGALSGRGVMVEADGLQVGDGQAPSTGVELDRRAAKVTMTLSDSNGKVLNQYDLAGPGGLDSGVHTFNLTNDSGQVVDSAGAVLGDGRYKVSVSAETADGKAVSARTLQAAMVNGVMTDGEAAMLDLGPNMSNVAMADVKKIF